MASSFTGWGTSWGDSWGQITADPNAMVGAASFSFQVTGQLTAEPINTMAGDTSFSLQATGQLTAAPTATQLGGTFLLALHGTGGASQIPERRAKAGAAVKLLKIVEGRAELLSARAGVTAKSVRAAGYQPIVVDQPAFPGYVRLLGCRATSRANSARASATATTVLLRYTVDTRTNVLHCRATGTATLLQCSVDTNGIALRSSGKGLSGLLSSQAASSCERVNARGVRNMADYELAVIATIVDIHR